MAGSWSHMTTNDRKLRNVENFHSMLDTGGDVYEAAEECFGMVWYLASALANAYAANSLQVIDRDDAAVFVEEAWMNYTEGLALGGVEDE